MLSHVDDRKLPAMVNVSEKPKTERHAVAGAEVLLPPEIAARLSDGELHVKKGPVIATAIIAGTLAAKKTADLIPFCHQIPLQGCSITVDAAENNRLIVRCRVACTAETGVEMEALVGASVTALTIYDMLKCLSHDIVIGGTRLISKSGGKSDYACNDGGRPC